MYCATCDCQFEGWRGRCPVCREPMQEEPLRRPTSLGETLPYAELLERVRREAGQLAIEVVTTQVGAASERSFPYSGFGFAWARRMQGSRDGIVVDLNTTEVGKDRQIAFPYYGFGFAWAACLEGSVAGNPVSLIAERVCREKKRRFPYRGYGFAWTAEFAGECGEWLEAQLLVTEVGRRMTWSFPYYGFGYAWEKKGVLTLALREGPQRQG